MRSLILFFGAIVILGAFNFLVYQKEAILESGSPILLKLAPADPRSLMQGDYMRFRYDIVAQMRNIDKNQLKDHHFAVIRPDANNVAQFVKLYTGEPLASNEKLIKYHYREQYARIEIKPDTFMFQEGLQSVYQKAAYAIFHYQGSQDYLLTGVANADRQPLNP